MKEIPRINQEELESLIAECEGEPSFYVDFTDPSDVTFFESATIAENLGPLLHDHIETGSTMFVLGDDGPNISATDYPWMNLLESWLRDVDLNLTYFLVNPTEAALERLKLLHQIFGDQIAVYRGGESTARLVGDGRSHFVLLENPDQFWYEEHHPVGETKARNCRYYPPGVARQSAQFRAVRDVLPALLESGERILF